jgi:hypothetical protein
LYLDAGLTQAASNPYTTDQYANYSFFVSPGNYIVQITVTNNVVYSYFVTAQNATGNISIQTNSTPNATQPTLNFTNANGCTWTNPSGGVEEVSCPAVTSITGGTGLSGGTITGSGTLAILSAYQLPQGCPTPSLPSWNGTNWTCTPQPITGLSTGVFPQAASGTTLTNSNPQLDTSTNPGFFTFGGSDGLILPGSAVTFATLPVSPPNGTVVQCLDCNPSCTASTNTTPGFLVPQAVTGQDCGYYNGMWGGLINGSGGTGGGGSSSKTFPNIDDATSTWGICYIGMCSGGSPGGNVAPASHIFSEISTTPPCADGSCIEFSETSISTGSGNQTNILATYKTHDSQAQSAAIVAQSFTVSVYNPGNWGNASALEFDQFIFVSAPPGQTCSTYTCTEFMFGSQCNGGFWDIFQQGTAGVGGAWITTPVTCALLNNTPGWHTITENVHRIAGDTNGCTNPVNHNAYPCEYYDSITVDGINTLFNTGPTSAGGLPSGWGSDTGFQFQIDIAGNSKTVTEYLDSASYTEYTALNTVSGLPTASASGQVPAANGPGTTYFAQSKQAFDVRDCTVALCGTLPVATADFAAALATLQSNLGSGTIIDARNPGAFASTGGTYCPGGGAFQQCVFSNSDISAGLGQGFQSVILWGNYWIITSAPWTTTVGAHQWIGVTSGASKGPIGTALIVCYAPQNSGLTCGPAGFPQFPTTATRSVGGPFLDGSPYTTGTISVASGNNPTVTGVGTTWTSAMVGGYLTSCATSSSHGATCPNATNACSALITAVNSTTSLTVSGNWGSEGNNPGVVCPTGVAGLTYALYHPTAIPILSWAGGVSNDAYQNNSFGSQLQDFFIDPEGMPLAIGLLLNGAQERDGFHRIHVAMNSGNFNNGGIIGCTPPGTGSNCTSEVATASIMAGMMTDRTFNYTGEAGPAHYSTGTMDITTGPSYIASSSGVLPYPFAFEGYDILRGNIGDSGNTAFNQGTVTGKNLSLLETFYDCGWYDGFLRIEIDNAHCEFTERGLDLGQTNGGNGYVVRNVSTANQGGATNVAPVHFYSGVTGSMADNISVIGNSQKILQDDSPGGQTITAAGSGCPAAGCTVVHYEQSGAFNGTPGLWQVGGIQSTGSQFTASGCTNGTLVGGAANGSFKTGVSGACTVVITIGGANPITANNGWHCDGADETTAAGNGIYQSAHSTTTGSLTLPAGNVSGDVISFSCEAY